MKILLSNKFFYPRGGDCIHTMQLKELLEQHGHEVAVFSMQYTDNKENKYSEYWPSEVDFSSKLPLKLLSALNRPFGVKEVKTKWNKLLADFKPDVVHVHNIHSQLSPVIAQLAQKQKIPIVWTLHDYKLLCPASAFLKTDATICDQCLISKDSVIKNRCIKGSLFASILGYWEARKWNANKLQNYTNQFISPSKFIKKKMEEGGYAEHKIIHQYNFANNDKFQDSVELERNDEIIYVGRISIEKGIESLCRASQNVKNSKLLIIGDGPLKKDLEQKYASSNIHFLGFQEWSFIKDRLSNAALLVIPSQWYENNPLTIIEAFALGTPVLGANIGGIPELIQDGINGMTFESGNIQDLSIKIQKMLDYKLWDYQKIKEEAKIKFSAQKYYDNLIEIYTQAVTNGNHQ
jgi:glycosyltransferase involved in cell wall biosynthesis